VPLGVGRHSRCHVCPLLRAPTSPFGLSKSAHPAGRPSPHAGQVGAFLGRTCAENIQGLKMAGHGHLNTEAK